MEDGAGSSVALDCCYSCSSTIVIVVISPFLFAVVVVVVGDEGWR